MTPPDDSPTPEDPAQAEQRALRDALDALLAPLARLAVARGLPYAVLQEAVKRAVVQAASATQQQVPLDRRASRVSTVTGIHRREVSRLLQPIPAPATQGRSKASEVFARWLTSRDYRNRRGEPRVLPRLGPKPSFESLAQEVTRDVHSRSLLDELLRLGLAEFDEVADRVSLSRDGFVPRGDEVRMLGFLSDNVSDHLSAAVDNVVLGGRRHFEQAVFADGLSEASIVAVRALVGPQWKLLLEALVPSLQALVDTDAALPAADQRRIRVGLYAFDDVVTADAAQSAGGAALPQRKRLARRNPSSS